MTTKIEWAHVPGYRGETWNPVTGCSEISPGCKNCYAERMAKRLSRIPGSGYPAENPFGVRVHENRWRTPIKKKTPTAFFVCSMGDLFHPDVPRDAMMRVFNTAVKCPQHLFLLLTKRPDNALKLLHNWGLMPDPVLDSPPCGEWLPDNIWFGVTVENQEQADKRIPPLFAIPAAKRFISCEPMLSFVDIQYVLSTGLINQVICGGETGPGARPMSPDCARSLRDQCQAAGVPFFLKSRGEWGDEPFSSAGKAFPSVTMGGEQLFRCGKKLAGRLLDGKEWNEFPK